MTTTVDYSTITPAPNADTATTPKPRAGSQTTRQAGCSGRSAATGIWPLALASAQAFPARVLGIVLSAVTSASRREVEWIAEGVGMVFLEAWERFASHAGRWASLRGMRRSIAMRRWRHLTLTLGQCLAS